jgi:hypothetical protein
VTSRYVTDAQLAELPEGLRALAGEVRQLAVRSTRLAVVPGWVRELTRVRVCGCLLQARECRGRGHDEAK